MPTVCIQMHFHRHAGLNQRGVVNQRLLYTVHVVVFCLHQKRGRRLAGDGDIGIQLAIRGGEMPRIDRHREVRAAAFGVGSIHGWIPAALGIRADFRHQVSARREPQHANLVRIDVPLHCMKANQSHRSLHVLQ